MIPSEQIDCHICKTWKKVRLDHQIQNSVKFIKLNKAAYPYCQEHFEENEFLRLTGYKEITKEKYLSYQVFK
jgi:hypothetical protein